SQSSAANPSHTYTTVGQFQVTLVVTDTHGAASGPKRDTADVRAPAVASNHVPVADFRMSVRSGPAPLTVTFTNKSSDSDGDAFTSLWDFGDGSQSSASSPTHTFTTDGDFRVTLLLTGVHGGAYTTQRDSVSAESPITPPVEENHRPIADFRMSLRSGPAPLEVTFTNKSTDSDGDSITSLWDFGDGSKSTEFSPTHVFK